MLAVLAICLSLGINAKADVISSSPSLLIDVEEELAKISASCLTEHDFEQLVGNNFKYNFARCNSYHLLQQSSMTIGLEELRASLKLPPLPPWKNFNKTEPSDQELKSATTIEEYYNLREPRSEKRSLDSKWFFEHNITTAVKYLNKRLPSIRNIFKKTFASAPKVLDKESVDSMIELFHETSYKVDRVIGDMLFDYSCVD